jgi:hypothetical protein
LSSSSLALEVTRASAHIAGQALDEVLEQLPARLPFCAELHAPLELRIGRGPAPILALADRDTAGISCTGGLLVGASILIVVAGALVARVAFEIATDQIAVSVPITGVAVAVSVPITGVAVSVPIAGRITIAVAGRITIAVAAITIAVTAITIAVAVASIVTVAVADSLVVSFTGAAAVLVGSLLFGRVGGVDLIGLDPTRDEESGGQQGHAEAG